MTTNNQPEAEQGIDNPNRLGYHCMNESKNPHAAALGKLGGASKSDAKKKASKENGKKGGRPKNKIPGSKKA